MRNSIFTPKMDSIIYREVKRHPENLSVAFTEASKKLEGLITPSQISGRWYSKLRNSQTNKAFCLFGGKKKGGNIKYIGRNSKKKMSNCSLLKRIILKFI